jgi:ribosomal protein S18 acetylase RimI-like enzyme
MVEWYLSDPAAILPREPAIEIRAATERDYPAIARIQQASPEAAQWPVGDYSGFRILLATLPAERGRIPVGFCAWRQSTPDEAELLNLAVDPASRRRGVASALLTALADTALGTVFLEVAEPNLAAVTLYEHHGWVRNGVRKAYYDRGKINAIVMQKRP